MKGLDYNLNNSNNSIVVKFGGTSLATAEQIKKVAAIINENPQRKFVVASAPGKRFSDDIKITDLLYKCHSLARENKDFSEPLKNIHDRFLDIINGLGVQNFDIKSEIITLENNLKKISAPDYAASRGEYINSKIIAAFLNRPFIDAAELIFFNDDGSLNEEKTYSSIASKLKNLDNAVIPGFYGSLSDGNIKTFSRGGSDVTGSIIARGVNAVLYENWTDVSGMLSADPRIVDNPEVINNITYTELRELSYMGASVLHEDAVFPVRKARIPINIKNTNRPQDPGTKISASLPPNLRLERLKHSPVTGIAGKKGFTSIRVEKNMMNNQTGFGAALLNIFAEHKISFEHCPTGIDSISVIVGSNLFDPKHQEILYDINRNLNPDSVIVEDHLALIAVVGEAMVRSKGMAAKIFHALAEADINIRMIDQGSNELNIIIAVDESDYENAVRAIYKELVN